MDSIRQQVLGQSLGGFNDLLLRQTLGLCLPPFDPTKQPAKAAEVDTKVKLWDAMGRKPAAGHAGRAGQGAFLPVRSGALKLVNLYVVDCFGQTRKLIDTSAPSARQAEVIASAALPPAPAAYHARFSPRLAQPARLNFDWQPAGDASTRAGLRLDRRELPGEELRRFQRERRAARRAGERAAGPRDQDHPRTRKVKFQLACRYPASDTRSRDRQDQQPAAAALRGARHHAERGRGAGLSRAGRPGAAQDGRPRSRRGPRLGGPARPPARAGPSLAGS